MMDIKNILIGNGDPKVMAICLGVTGAALVANEVYYHVYVSNKMKREFEKEVIDRVRIKESMEKVKRAQA